MAKQIPLTQGKFATVDDEVYEWVMQWKWQANRIGNNWYAVRTEGRGANGKTILLHREIMNAPDGMEVDHVDGNGLNDQCRNLRLATRAQNGRNRGPQANNTSGYKGVSWLGRDSKWQAGIKVNGKQIKIGHFDDPVEAARAYDKAARKHHKEFAYQNFPEGEQQ